MREQSESYQKYCGIQRACYTNTNIRIVFNAINENNSIDMQDEDSAEIFLHFLSGRMLYLKQATRI